MDEEIKNYQGCLRLNKHDGVSQIIIKSQLLGLYTYITRDKEELINNLKELKNKIEPYIIDTYHIKDLNWINQLEI
jgi:site-specific DNA-adenine methylase